MASVPAPLSGGPASAPDVEADSKAAISRPLISATAKAHAGVAEWGSESAPAASRTACSGPDGTPRRCLDWTPAPDSATWTHMAWANAVAYVVVIAVNGALAATDMLQAAGGFNNGQQSRRHKTAITPDGWAFAIWSPIFILAALFVVAQAFDRQLRSAATVANLWLSVGICAWTFAFDLNQLGLSLAIMLLGILAPLLYLHGAIGESAVVKATSAGGALATRVWISMYLGWISVATIVNVAVVGTPVDGVADWGWSASNWSQLMLTVATALGFAMLLLHADVVYAGVLVWAFLAIAANQGDASEYPGDDRVVVAAKAYAAALGVVICLVLLTRCNWRK